MRIRTLVAFSFVFIFDIGFSQQSFIQHKLTFGSSPHQITLADIDNDTDLDILAFYYEDNVVAWHRNDGSGYFDSIIVINDNEEILYLGYASATDIDNDGNIDIIAGGTNDIYWYKNLGNGNFSLPIIITSNVNNAKSVYTCDLDNDNHLDVIAASYSDSTLLWIKNLGNGVFGTPQIIATNVKWPRSVRANDLDDDGIPDILYIYDASKVAWHKNLGFGIFSNQQLIINNMQGPFFTMSADLNNDSLPDILSSQSQSSGSEKIAWYQNLGNGSFSAEIVINNNLKVPKYYYPADFDNDNDLDIVTTSWDNDSLVWQENLGNGTFAQPQLISNTLNGPYGVHAGDINGDGFEDIIVGCENSSSIEIYINHFGSGTFTHTQTISNSAAEAYCVQAEDIDDDGLIDIISASVADNKIAWYKNLGNRNFSMQKVISNSRSFSRSVCTADLNNDATKDVISTAFFDTLAWHNNLGNGNFDAPIKIPNTLHSNLVKAKDMDNDGLIDIVAAFGDTVKWSKNIGNGNFGAWNFLLFLPGLYDFDIEDLNNDSYNDLVYGSGSTLIANINDGNGSFLPLQYINSYHGAISLCLDDMNNDGFNDIVYTGKEGSNKVIKWYPNDGFGNFTTSSLVSEIPYYSYTICTSDINNDNDPDIIAATGGSNSSNGILYWSENLGGGFFGPLQVIDSLGGDMICMVPADFDNDNDNDLAIAFHGKSSISWFENNLGHWLDTIVICAEDSTLIFGNWQSQPGNYFDTLQNAQGNDSINIIRLDAYPSYHTYDTITICEGESFFFNGQLLDATGLYHANFQSVQGCDSIGELSLTVIPAPLVNVYPYQPDSVSIQASVISLPNVFPSGGVFSGTGVVTNGFDPALAGLGEFWTSYTIVDTATGCPGKDSTQIKVYDPIGIDEVENQHIKLYPNPGTGNFVLTGTVLESVRISTLDGELVKEVPIENRNEVRFSLKGQAKGTYLVHIVNRGVEIKRLLVLM